MAQGVSIGTAWSEAAAFVRREKRLLAPLVLALMVVPATVSQLVQPTNPFAGGSGFEPWMVIGAVALLAGVVGQMAVSRLAMGWDGSLGEVISLGLKRLPVVVGAFILFFLCVVAMLFPMIVILTVLGGGDPAATSSRLANLLALVTIFAAAPRILLAPAIAMTERSGPWGLVKAAWRASRAPFWRLLGFFLLFLAATLIFALAVSAVVGSIVALAIGPPEPMSVSRLIIALVSGLVQGAVATIYGAMLGRIVAQLPEPSTSGT